MANENPTEVEEKVNQSEPVIESKNDESSAKCGKPEEEDDAKKEEDASEPESDPYYPPIIYLPEIVVNSGEDGEEEMFKRRAKLYR